MTYVQVSMNLWERIALFLNLELVSSAHYIYNNIYTLAQ